MNGISSALRLCLLLLIVTANAQTHARSATARPPTKQLDPTGPTAVIDTSAGRFTCRLYTQQAPLTSANFIALAEGTKDWTDASGVVQHTKPFYDALQIFGMSDAVAGGGRAALHLGTAGPDVTPEKTGLIFDHAGRLAALTPNGKQSSSGFAVTDHPDLEWAKRGIVFGQCDDASVNLSAKLSHQLLSTDNHPDHPVVLRSIRIVAPGEPIPPEAPPIPGGSRSPRAAAATPSRPCPRTPPAPPQPSQRRWAR